MVDWRPPGPDNLPFLARAKSCCRDSASWVVRQGLVNCGFQMPHQASRAYNREAALQMQVVSKFTYTLETLIQAGKLLVAVDHVPGTHQSQDS